MGYCAARRLSVVRLLASKGENICYVKECKIYSAFRAAIRFPEVGQWLLMGTYTEGPRLLMDGGSI